MSHHALLFGVRMTKFHRSSGAHRIASFLRSHDWDIEVCDFASAWPLDKLKEYVKSRVTKDTTFFGFSPFINFWTEDLNLLLKWMKETYPDIYTIIGGQSVLITSADEEYVDFWVDSYGEIAMLELVRYLIGKQPYVIFDDEELKKGRRVIRALHTYPSWNLKNYQNKLEHRDFLEPYEWLTTELGRGCKFQCDFCNFPILGLKDDVSRDAKNFEEELIYHYNEFGIKHYYLADETINDRTEKIIKFADVVESLDFNPYFSGFMRADLLVSRKQDWEHIVRMNLGGHYYGIESMNQESAKIVKKGMNVEKLQEGILEWKNYATERMHFRGTMSFIIGLPKETEQSWNKTKKWLFDNWTDQSAVVFPLDLSDALNQDSWTNISKFSKNLLSYGITEMTETDIVKELDKHTYVPTVDSHDRFFWFHENTYVWKHQTMNYIQAQEICNNFWNDESKNFKIENWELGNAQFIDSDVTEIEDIINLQYLNTHKLDCENFINCYIDKKLNWSGE